LPAPTDGLPAPGATIVVAMSGGVDSAVTAAILRRQGFDVIGVTLQLYDHGAATGRSGTCCAGQDIHDARRTADHIGIPHYVLDYEARFRTRVIDAFADSYLRGETPVPCVTCNSQIKFSDLLGTARDLGASALATGHYIRRIDDASGPGLYRAADADRDQSYFLFNTTRAQLARLVFPIGSMAKADVRRLAHAFGLPIAEKADSQDICFVPSGRYARVIERLRPGASTPGRIVHVDGRVLGRHTGILNFTIGQRKGLGIATGAPLFVVRLDAERSEVVVGPRSALAVATLDLRDVNWIGPGLPADGRTISVRVRSSQPVQPARLNVKGASVGVTLEATEPGIAPGQACVFYSDETATARVLGGGTIAATRADRVPHPAVAARMPPDAYIAPG
jgi:tRNA-specific 2-thiouridylase